MLVNEEKALKGKKCLVFGGAGFLASALIKVLARANYSVVIIDKEGVESGPLVTSYIFDVSTELKLLPVSLKEFDYVFNFIAQPDIERSVSQVRQTFELNLMFNIRLLEALRDSGSKAKYIFASSVYAVSASGLFYGISKWAAEKAINEFGKLHNLQYLILRYGSVYGPGADRSNRIYKFVSQALMERKITFLGDGMEEREFINVDDAAELTVDVLQEDQINETFVITGTERYSYFAIGQMLNEIFGGDIQLDFKGVDYGGHYYYTPYSFSLPTARKVVPKKFKDIGQGLIEVAESLSQMGGEK